MATTQPPIMVPILSMPRGVVLLTAMFLEIDELPQLRKACKHLNIALEELAKELKPYIFVYSDAGPLLLCDDLYSDFEDDNDDWERRGNWALVTTVKKMGHQAADDLCRLRFGVVSWPLRERLQIRHVSSREVWHLDTPKLIYRTLRKQLEQGDVVSDRQARERYAELVGLQKPVNMYWSHMRRYSKKLNKMYLH
jgi:hypothetical protein